MPDKQPEQSTARIRHWSLLKGGCLGLGLLLAQAACAQAASQSSESQGQTDANPSEQSRWYIRVGALDAFYDSSATIKVGGVTVPGATARVSDGGTVTVDVGYEVTRNISLLLMGGFPPKPSVTSKRVTK